MDITPREIQERQFHDAFRGYSHEEVDLFLDEVAAAFDRVYAQNQQFHHKLLEIEQELTQARGSEDMLKRMLVTAQETADKAVQEAREKAQGMVTSSESRANQIAEEAKAKAERLIAEAEARAEAIVAEAVSKERELQVSIETLKSFESEYRARILAFIESQLKQLGQPVPPPAFPQTSHAGRNGDSVETRDQVETRDEDKAKAGYEATPRRDPQDADAEPQAVSRHAQAGAQPSHHHPTRESEEAGKFSTPSGSDVDADQPVTVPESVPEHVGAPSRSSESVLKVDQDPAEPSRTIKELFWGEE